MVRDADRDVRGIYGTGFDAASSDDESRRILMVVSLTTRSCKRAAGEQAPADHGASREYSTDSMYRPADHVDDLDRFLRAQVPSPQGVEQIKWGHPAYVHPDGVILFMFSAHKAHASFAVTPTTREAFADELLAFRTGKGTVALPYDSALPRDLLQRMIQFRIHEYEHDAVRWM